LLGNTINKYVLDNNSPGNGFKPPCEITEYDSTTKKGTMQCTTTEGVGKDLWLRVQVGQTYTQECPSNQCKIRSSAPFDAKIKYARPIVASYTVGGDQANNMNTAGKEDLVVVGSNFGPVGTPVDSATYGEGTPPYGATGCTVISHTQMNCKTAAGAGTNHKLVVTIAGQKSTVPVVGYGLPTIQTSECDNTGTNKFQCHCVNGTGTFGSKCSGYQQNGKWFIPAITIGSTPCDPSKTPSPCTTPVATLADASNTHSLSTRGGQRIVLSGINFGATAPDGTFELEEVRLGPSFAVSRTIPIVSSAAAAAWRASSVVPGCTLDVPHFSVLCNTPPGIGRNNYFFFTVSKQKMLIGNQGQTSYNLPNVEKLTPKSGIIRTNGGDVVAIEGLDFGASLSDVSIEAWLIRDGASSAAFKSGAGSGLVIALDSAKPTKDIIEFPVPTSYGSYNVYIRVYDTVTGQSELSANFVPLRYDAPKIATTTITVGQSADNQVSISGDSFCSTVLSATGGCGDLFKCQNKDNGADISPDGVGGCGACFTGDPPLQPSDPPQQIANPNNPVLGTSQTWTHDFAKVSTTASTGCIYVRVGTSPLNYQYSNPVSFTTQNPLILQGEDLPQKTSTFVTRTQPYPTSALDDNSTPIKMKILIANLQDPTTSNLVIKVGPFGCTGDDGSAKIDTIDPHSQGHVVTIFVPESAGTDVHLKACFMASLASAPAIIHYLRPTVTSVRHLPYKDNNDVILTGQTGGLPTGGSAYNGFTPSQMDDAIATADSDVTKALAAKDAAQITFNGKDSAHKIAAADADECTNNHGSGGVCTSLEADEETKGKELHAARNDLYIKTRTYNAAMARKNGLVQAKSTPYTYQHIELNGKNFASECKTISLLL
jgi:hypothetical protein